ncbi:Ig-like domain-containing protein [Longimicrobium terrae]|uniref:Big-1 domain-containing protein n=1 Tax=Longimicrobium terrae TaxID=1639882 RepID=A0A841H0S7_9BACT|nr:Ig-like domain-containing protein [Longimicrobium terrae]MBB4637123.1 hypothetical protein [Longimicrobium terrae]MBB6071617.1 hypothetical protein [Longimicrobium terrae]NNC29967.1 Ig-like domain-containing protein [Longimicrobium terrae]
MSPFARLSLLAACLSLAACADQTPTASPETDEAVTLAGVRCTLSADQSSATCGAPAGRGDVILDGDGPYVQIAMTEVTRQNGVLTANVTLKNLTNKVLGFDGTEHKGVYVYMRTPPTNGVVWIDPRGTATFGSDVARPYEKFTSDLAPGATSRAQEWSFALNGATTFTLDLMVATRVPQEFGSIAADLDSIFTAVGRADVLTAQGLNPYGFPVAAPLRWTSRNPAVLRVDAATGTLQPVTPGLTWVVVQHAADRGFAADSVRVRANPAGPFTTAVTSGDNQAGAPGQPLASPLRVRITDANGAPIPGVVARWRILGSTGGSLLNVTTVTNANGEVEASWTLGSGADSVEVIAPSAASQNRVVFHAQIITATRGFTRVWTGAVSDVWETAGNWAPAGVPTVLDSVVVPVTARSPRASVVTQVRRLVVNTGATLELNTRMSVRSDALVSGQVTGTGVVRMNADTSSVRYQSSVGYVARISGRFPELEVATSVAQPRLSGNVLVARDIRLVSARLILGGNDLRVAGDAYIQGGFVGGPGSTGADSLDVRGNVFVSAGGIGGELGVLLVGGDILQTGGSVRPLNAHVTVLNGPAQQRVNLIDSREGDGNRLVNLRIENTGGLRVDQNLHVIIVDVLNGAPITGSDTLSTRNRLKTNGLVNLPGLVIGTTGGATLTVFPGSYQVLRTHFGGGIIPALPYQNLTVGNTTAGANLRIMGDFRVEGTFNTNGYSVVVDGTYTVAPGGSVVGTVTHN